jgi:uncharacterized protein YggT (Ycf19 family)
LVTKIKIENPVAKSFHGPEAVPRMSLIDFILNIVGLVLWLNWRAIPLAVQVPPGASLASTLRRAGPPRPRLYYLAGLIVLLAVRALLYWQLGGQAGWVARIPLGPTTVGFRSDLPGRMALFSVCSFGVALGIFYLCLLLLSWINGPVADTEPGQRLVRAQLGLLDRWPGAMKLLLPLLFTAALWCLLNPWLARLGVVPRHAAAPWRVLAQGAVIGLGVYLALKFFLVGILALHLFGSFVYLGELPIWSFVNTTAHSLLRPLQWLPLRAGRVDFAPVLAMLLLLFTAPFTQRGLTQLFQKLI